MLSRLVAVVLALLALFYACSAFAQVSVPPVLRLPDAVQPRHYTAELTIDPSEESFRASIGITLEIRKPTTIATRNAAT